ncbi:MAG: hypothetical protein CFK49_06855 [Armatimonadetes bacterium JP3_11]|nr:MAG: hypothetical protein CFK49_06855 [Armatimonadetes bacterium JP3_11]RMH10723.1 MAG: helix-turn-helix domain-containing protein [Armatimonadota bacterium]
MFALIEIIGEDRNYALKLQSQQEPAATLSEPATETRTQPEPEPVFAVAQVAERSNGSNASPKEATMEQLLRLLYENPALSRSKLAERLGCSRQTLYNYLQELESRGYIRRTGNGYETVVTPLPRNGVRNGTRSYASFRETRDST